MEAALRSLHGQQQRHPRDFPRLLPLAPGTRSCRAARWCRATIRPCCSPTAAWSSSRTSSPGRSGGRTATATTSQKCVRAGGKHNDLDNVGYTARHHTFFEMLGNFSFGDYFKDVAIEHAWTLLTARFRHPEGQAAGHRLCRGRRGGARIWKAIAGLPDERIIRIATSDNFWRMGDTGPCGPCSEIFYDHGPSIPGGPPGSPDEDGDRFIEIWNLVFMQFEEGPPGTRAPLPRPSIDTGMGLERFAAILQGKHDNYDTDTMRALILASADATGQAAGWAVQDQPPGRGGPSAQHVVPDRRRRAAVQGGPRLRAAADHAPGHAAPAHDGHAGGRVPQAGAGAGAADGRGLSGAAARGGADHGDDAARGRAVQGDAGPRPRPARGGDGAAGRWRGAAGRGGVQAVRHVRVPARPDAGRVARAGQAGRRGRVRRGDGRAAHPGAGGLGRDRATRRPSASGSNCASAWGRREFLGYTTETAEAEIIGLVVDGAEVARPGRARRSRSSSTRRRSMRESGGQVGDTGIITGPGGLRIEVERHAEEAGRPVRASRPGRGGHGRGRARRCTPRSTKRGAAPSARITARPICCMQALRERLGNACRAEGQPERAGPAALRREPAHADHPRRPRGGRGAR